MLPKWLLQFCCCIKKIRKGLKKKDEEEEEQTPAVFVTRKPCPISPVFDDDVGAHKTKK